MNFSSLISYNCKVVHQSEKWQSGDMKAFEVLFQQYKGLVLKTAMLIINNLEEAEDILQDVFMNVWEARNTFDSTKGKFTTWLYRITINQSISRYRKKQPAAISFEETSHNPTSIHSKYLPAKSLEINWEYERLMKAVDLLDNRHRIVLILRYFNDLPYKEIAKVLDIPVGTIKSRIYNALKSLRGQMNTAITDVNT